MRTGSAVLKFVSEGFLTGDADKRALYRFVLGRRDLDREVETILVGFGIATRFSVIWKPEDTFALSKFAPLPDMLAWLDGEWKEKCLVIVGKAGCGKTRCAAALAFELCTRKNWEPRIAVARDTESLRDEREPYSVVVFDEVASLLESWVKQKKNDSVKHLLDVELLSVLPARNRDLILQPRPRTITSQKPLEQICQQVPLADWNAIDRRCMQVRVDHDLRKLPKEVSESI